MCFASDLSTDGCWGANHVSNPAFKKKSLIPILFMIAFQACRIKHYTEADKVKNFAPQALALLFGRLEAFVGRGKSMVDDRVFLASVNHPL